MREIKRGMFQGLLVALFLAGSAFQGLAQGVAYNSMQNTN
jgi:hypothetical protein